MVTVNEYTRDQDFTGAALVLDQFGEPQRPFHVLSSNTLPSGARCFDLALAESLHTTSPSASKSERSVDAHEQISLLCRVGSEARGLFLEVASQLNDALYVAHEIV